MLRRHRGASHHSLMSGLERHDAYDTWPRPMSPWCVCVCALGSRVARPWCGELGLGLGLVLVWLRVVRRSMVYLASDAKVSFRRCLGPQTLVDDEGRSPPPRAWPCDVVKACAGPASL